jgi:hypothetical protein
MNGNSPAWAVIMVIISTIIISGIAGIIVGLGT